MIVTEKAKKLTRRRTPQIAREKRPIEHDAFYTIRELTDPVSPYWLCSESTIFRALSKGDLVPNYVGRKALIQGSAIHKWILGKGGGARCEQQ